MRRRRRSAKANSSPTGGECASAQAQPLRSERNKNNYDAYLRSPEWAALRKRALARDRKCRAPSCRVSRGLHVHHVRYPKVLGTEPVEWLMCLCREHHERLHELTKMRGVGINRATAIILGQIPDTYPETRKGRVFNVTVLPDGDRPPLKTWIGKARPVAKHVQLARGGTNKNWDPTKTKSKRRRAK